MKKTVKTAALMLLAIVLITLTIFGAILLEGSSDGGTLALGIASYLTLAVIVILSVLSQRATNKMIKAYFGSAKDIYEDLTSSMDSVREDLEGAITELNKKRRNTLIYLSACILLSFLLSFLSWGYLAAAGTFDAAILTLIAFLYFSDVSIGSVYRLVKDEPVIDFKKYSDKNEYHEIYSVAEEAMRALDLKLKVRINFEGGNSCAVARIGKTVSLIIGTNTLALLTRDELYSVIMHEMTHIKEGDSLLDTNAVLNRFLATGTYPFDPFKYLLAAPAYFFGFTYQKHMTFASVATERNADKNMALGTSPETAANALAKISAFDFFFGNADYYMKSPMYSDEGNLTSYYTRLQERFAELLPEMEAEWRRIIDVEIQGRAASHPIVRERIAAIGAVGYSLSLPDDKGAYRDECKRAFERIEGETAERMKELFKQRREEAYLKPKAVVDEWVSCGKPYDPDTVRDTMDALFAVCMWDDVFSLAEHILDAEKDSPERKGLYDYAKHMRGLIYFKRRDARAIPDLYDAVRENNNYEEDMSLIGELCCMLGLEDELNKYREIAVEMAQKLMDESPLNELLPTDELSLEDTLSEDIRKRNLDCILNSGGEAVKAVYLVRKKVTDTLYASVYVIDFNYCDENNEKISDCMDKIFTLLDNSDGQYSLFYYDKTTGAAVRKVEGSRIYNSAEAL